MRYSQGTINTAKGFTGQYNDSLTGLDYYNARYYDPVAGVFLSADTAQGNLQGMNPYAYVNGNPETHNDPTGLRPISKACPTYSCNAPVDMSAISAAIDAWLYGTNARIINTAAVTSVATGAQPSLYKGGSVQQLSSCGLSQTLCGHYGVNFAVYFGGIQFSVPGDWCVECGQPGGGSDNGGGSGGNSGTFSSDTGSTSSASAQQLMDDPYAIQVSEEQLTFDNADARAAFTSALKRLEDLGGPLSDGLVTTKMAVNPRDPELVGVLTNGAQEPNGLRGWRLEFDDTKQAHFNWYDWTLGKRTSGLGRYGAEKFPGSYELVIEMIVGFEYNGVQGMLNP